VRRIEDEGWALIPAAEAAGISERSARKWLAKWRAEGEVGLLDRSSAPRRSPTRLAQDRLETIEALRRLRMTAAEIAEVLGMALSTVSRWLKRIGLGRRGALAPPEPPNHYERKRPGELIHVDVKKLGRIHPAGHRITGTRRERAPRRQEGTVRVGHGRLGVRPRLRRRRHPPGYVEVLPDEKGASAAGFLRRAVDWLAPMGVTVERVLSDNGACYLSRVHAEACRELGIRHLRTRPYRPLTNGKAERFIQTMTNGWAYGAIYGSSAERTAALPGWLDHYNFRRRHGSLGHRPPAARLAELEQPRE
jgi:transposase